MLALFDLYPSGLTKSTIRICVVVIMKAAPILGKCLCCRSFFDNMTVLVFYRVSLRDAIHELSTGLSDTVFFVS